MFKQHGNMEATLAKSAQFCLLVRKLLRIARADRVDSIKVEAQAAIRAIVRSLTKKENELTTLIEGLSRQEVTQLQRIIDIEDKLAEEQSAMRPVLDTINPSERYSWSLNKAFGAIPFDIVELMRTMADDRIVTQRCTEDLDLVLTQLGEPGNELELTYLLNYATSFMAFIEEFVLGSDRSSLTPEYTNPQSVFTAIKAIDLVFFKIPKHQSKIVARVNMRRLIDALLGKLNDPKEIVRAEIERVVVRLARFLKAQELVLQVSQLFEGTRLNPIGQTAALRLQIVLLLDHNSRAKAIWDPGHGQVKALSQSLILPEGVEEPK